MNFQLVLKETQDIQDIPNINQIFIKTQIFQDSFCCIFTTDVDTSK